jgi:hypothetical protein
MSKFRFSHCSFGYLPLPHLYRPVRYGEAHKRMMRKLNRLARESDEKRWKKEDAPRRPWFARGGKYRQTGNSESDSENANNSDSQSSVSADGVMREDDGYRPVRYLLI